MTATSPKPRGISVQTWLDDSVHREAKRFAQESGMSLRQWLTYRIREAVQAAQAREQAPR